MITKKQIGITIDKDLLRQFKIALRKHKLKISPIVEELIRYFLSTLEKQIDD